MSRILHVEIGLLILDVLENNVIKQKVYNFEVVFT